MYNKKKRYIINEKLSISDIVNTYTDKISEKIIDLSVEQFNKKQLKYSPITNAPYVEGSFVIDTFDFGNDKMPSSLKVEYIMYDINSAIAYNSIIKTEDKGIVNSESDFKQCYVKIVSGYIGDTLLPDFYTTIAHEVTHIYQYAQGLQKKIDLYDAVIKLYNSNVNDENTIGYVLYYTFKHEQDAMTHQFYEFLNSKDYNNTEFEKALESYTEFKNFTNSINNVKKIDKNNLKNILNGIGLSIGDYNQRIHYAYKRFIQKMKNAFDRNMYELAEHSKKFIIGYNMSKQMILEECEKKIGYKLTEKIEKIYEF